VPVRPFSSFLITSYREDDRGVLVASLPDQGLCHGQGEQPCRLSIDHLRERKTGPGFALTVLKCHSHGMAFTLYPPGHVPYGRCAVAPVAPDASTLATRVEASGCEPRAHDLDPVPPQARTFSGTVFDAAIDAAQGLAWQREAQLEPPEDGINRWWRTQHRHLTLATRLLGVAPELARAEQLEVAAVLGVPALLLSELARGLEGSGGYAAQGQAVVEVLACLARGRSLADRIVRSGHIVGLWREPFCWDRRRGGWLRTPFRAPGTRDPPRLH
jgi:hypothetical protein